MTDPGGASVDHKTNPWHRNRGFGNVGRQNDAASIPRIENKVLLVGRKPRVQRQDLGSRPLQVCITQLFGQGSNVGFGWQEDQRITIVDFRQLLDRVHHQIQRIVLHYFFLGRRTIKNIHRIRSAFDADDRHRSTDRFRKMIGEALRVDRSRRDDQS